MAEPPFDSLILVSFGGPEGRDDVMPFLENVLRGKNVPRERMLEVAEHYYHFDGISPINQQNRDLMDAMRAELKRRNINLPLYWGNRNWHPLLPDTLREMSANGHRRALAFFTSIFSSYSGCRQYRENIAAAQSEVGSDAPSVEKVRMGFNHPKFIEAQADLLSKGLKQFADASAATVLFTAHSIPNAMSDNCRYVEQLKSAAGLIAAQAGASTWNWCFKAAVDLRTNLGSSRCVRSHRRTERTRCQPNRDCAVGLYLRSHGSSVRPRYRGSRSVREVEHSTCACAHSGRASSFRRDDR